MKKWQYSKLQSTFNHPPNESHSFCNIKQSFYNTSYQDNSTARWFAPWKRNTPSNKSSYPTKTGGISMKNIKINYARLLSFVSLNYWAANITFVDTKNTTAPIRIAHTLNMSRIPANVKHAPLAGKKPLNCGYKNNFTVYPIRPGNTSLLPCPLNYGIFSGVIAHYWTLLEKLPLTASKN